MVVAVLAVAVFAVTGPSVFQAACCWASLGFELRPTFNRLEIS